MDFSNLAKLLRREVKGQSNYLQFKDLPFVRINHEGNKLFYHKENLAQIQMLVFLLQVCAVQESHQVDGPPLFLSQDSKMRGHKLRFGLAVMDSPSQRHIGQTLRTLGIRSDGTLIIDKKNITEGDTVGLGLNVYRQSLIVSHNGDLSQITNVGTLGRLMSMHPSVSFESCQIQLQFNFGAQKFSCQIQDHFRNSKTLMIVEIALQKQPAQSEIQRMIGDYLYKRGMQETIHCFQQQSGEKLTPTVTTSQQSEEIEKMFLSFQTQFFKQSAYIRKFSTEYEYLFLLRRGFSGLEQVQEDSAVQNSDLKTKLEKTLAPLFQFLHRQEYLACLAAVEDEFGKQTAEYKQFKLDILAKVFVTLIKRSQHLEAIQFGRTQLSKFKQNKFTALRDGDLVFITFNDLAAHLSGRGELFEETSQLRLRLAILKMAYAKLNLVFESELEKQLKKVNDTNKKIVKMGLPLQLIKYSL